CPTDLWEITLPIWNEKSKERPSFSQLVKKLNKVKRLHDNSKKIDKSIPKEGEEESPYQTKSEYNETFDLTINGPNQTETEDYERTPGLTINRLNQIREYEKTPGLANDEPTDQF